MSSSKPTPIRRRRRGGRPKLVTPAPAVDSTAADLADVEEQDTEDLPEAAALEVDIPPAEPQQSSFLDRAKAKLGLNVKEADVEPKARASSGRLTKGQQQFVDLAAPIAQQIGVMAADFAWGKAAGPEYVPYLSPSDEVADKIMLPLTRIAARLVSIKYKGHISPNQVDAAASITAVVGYAISSIKLYQAIKKEEQYGQFAQEEASNGSRPIQPGGGLSRRAVASDRQDRHAAASPGVVRGADVEEVSADSITHGYPGDPGGVDTRNLTAAERGAFEKLNRLRMLDYESRRRRSGYAAGL